MSSYIHNSNKRLKLSHPQMGLSHSGQREDPIVLPSSPSPSPPLLSPIPLAHIQDPTPPELSSQDYVITQGREAWRRDFDECKRRWGVAGELVGYGGMIGKVEMFKPGDMDDSATMTLVYDDIEGDPRKHSVNVVFSDLYVYPSRYSVLLYCDDALPRHAERVMARFTDIYDLELVILFCRILSALQGDDMANGGEAHAAPQEETQETQDGQYDEDDEEDMFDLQESLDGPASGPFDASEDKPPAWAALKLHFQQAKKMGYRPGLTKVSDFCMISLSIPLKNLPLDPNTLAIWDDGLVDAWKTDQRLTMLIQIRTYPIKVDDMTFYLGLHQHYKPSPEEMLATIRGSGLPSFYLAAALLHFLKVFPLAHKARTDFSVDWSQADAVAFDQDLTTQVFTYGGIPPGQSVHDPEDPVVKGYEDNLSLVAFWWTLRRFTQAHKYCLKCGLEVKVPSLRPYVCDRPLCLYAFMSLGLGPSVEHVITRHPSVVDVLLTFAHTAANSTSRMNLPLLLHIEVPVAFGIPEPTLLDHLAADQQRKALKWLIEQLPKVSEIKKSLESGVRLTRLGVPSGSIGVLRWVVGSCRAYLKEAKPGEGVLQPTSDASGQGLKQFVFVVGSPAQEANFKNEVDKAKLASQNVVNHPSLLAFHGSVGSRWHNILRNGLDYQEIANARAFGNGVYFASQYETSLAYCNRSQITPRSNADFAMSSAIALVELVNVPHTFVSCSPYYVVDQIKQIKPFLLLVAGSAAVSRSPGESDGELFVHDPALQIKPTFAYHPLRVKMPRQLDVARFVDFEPDDEEDERILRPMPGFFKPSPLSRLNKLQKMAAPSSTSVTATRALGKAFKEVIKAQDEGDLPFYVHPDTESLYCWTLELHDFADSRMKTEMKQLGIHSVIAEMRFPAAYPFSPPFMRILHPRFLPFISGGGGNITAGGSICNEILTSTGWNAAYTVEAMVRDIMTNMTEATPPARIDMVSWDRPYNLNEAMAAYKRVASVHGWEIPQDFDNMSR